MLSELEEKLVYACEDGDLNLVKELITNIDPSTNYNAAIQYASSEGRLAIVEFLLQDLRVDPSDDQNLAIIWAAENGHFKVVKRLLADPRVDPFDYNNEAILRAIENQHNKVVELLTEYLYKIDAPKYHEMSKLKQ